MYIKNLFGPKQMDMLARSVSLIKNIKETVVFANYDPYLDKAGLSLNFYF